MNKFFKAILVASMISSVAYAAPDTKAAAPAIDPNMKKAIDIYLDSEQGQEKIGLATQAYFRRLQEKMKMDQEKKMEQEVEAQFKNPINIEIGKSPVKGPANAKVTIIEFSDFQCPYCTRGRSTIEQVLKAYPNDVKVAFKNLPLPFHDQAMPAAKAALAAGKQNKFWEMHDALFDNQANLNDKLYEEQAKKLGLNVEQFKKDLASPDIEKQIKEDMEIAAKHQFQGTPGFVVGGVAVKGAYPFEHFKKIIDRKISGK